MTKHHAAGTQRCPGQRHALELTSLFDSQFFEGPQLERAALSYSFVCPQGERYSGRIRRLAGL